MGTGSEGHFKDVLLPNLKKMSILPTRLQALNLNSDDKENFKHGGKSKVLGEQERNTTTITTKSEVRPNVLCTF